MDGCQEISRGFVIAGGDGAELLEFGEEILDEVTRFVKLLVILALVLAIGFGRDDGALAGSFERLDDTLVGVETFVGDHDVGRDLRQQDVGAVEIAGLSGREREAGRIAQSIDRRIDLGAQSAFAAADGFVFAGFFLAPAEC
jgi:hypothetical protein